MSEKVSIKVSLKKALERFGLRIHLSKNLWYQDVFEVLKRLNKNENPIIFDVGASTGSFSLQLQKEIKNCSVYAFEPFLEYYKILETNRVQFPAISTHNIALADAVGTQTFFVNSSKATNSLLPPKRTDSFIDNHAIPESQMTIPTMTLDAFCEASKITHIDLLKMDVQGGELKVLQGAKKMLGSQSINFIYSEVWFIEGYENQPLYHDVASYLASFGYKPFGLYNMHFRKDGHHLWGDAIFYKGGIL